MCATYIWMFNDMLQQLLNKKIVKHTDKDEEKKLNEIKKKILKFDNVFPLYDIYSNNIYFINKSNLEDRIFLNHYRIPDQKIIDLISENKNDKKKVKKYIDFKNIL